jgi:hypothetical protein
LHGVNMQPAGLQSALALRGAANVC